MGGVEVQRTLVKSVPELWGQLSEEAVLAPLLDGTFGEIRITHAKAESLIAWESEAASGAVELIGSGFGTRVRLTVVFADPVDPAQEEPAPTPRRGLLARLLRRRRAPEPQPEPPAPEPTIDPERAGDALRTFLDEVGSARHRPFTQRPQQGRSTA